MAKSESQVSLPVGPQHAYALVRDSGNQIPKFKPLSEDPGRYTIRWKRGWGLTNPIDVIARIYSQDGQTSVIHYEASILALADPFGFTKKTLEQFQTHLYAYQHAAQTGTPLPPAPSEERSIWVTVGILGCVVVFVALIFVLIIALALMQ